MSHKRLAFTIANASLLVLVSIVILLIGCTEAQSRRQRSRRSWMFDEAKQCLGNDGKQASLNRIKPEVYYFEVGQNKNGQQNSGGVRSPRHIFKLGYTDKEFREANINSSLPIKVIAHGFDNSFDITASDDWIQAMIDVLDKSPITTYTVFVFNWPNGFVRARDGLIKGYGIVAGTTRTLGTYLGSFLTRLNKAIGIRFDHTHLIGHSLGAHVVGFAGKNLQQNLPSGVKLARITGLDPAGPCFQLVYPKDRIDAEDAQYVDIIHTNSGLLGALQQLGTRDVYLNGGSLQPGCANWNSPCSHSVAYNVMTYEPTEHCQMVAYQCKSYDEFNRGACRNCQSDESRCTLVNFPINFAHDEYEAKVQNKIAFKPNSTELEQSDQDNLVTGLLKNNFRIFKSLNMPYKEAYYVNTGNYPSQSYCLQHYQVKLYTNIPTTETTSDNSSETTTTTTTTNVDEITVQQLKLFNDTTGQQYQVTMSKLTDLSGNKLGFGSLWTGLVTFDGDIQTFNRALVTVTSPSNSLADGQFFMGASLEFMSHICPKKRQLFSSVLCTSNLMNTVAKNDKSDESNNLPDDYQQNIMLETCNQLTSDQLESMFSAAPRASRSITNLFKWFN